VAVLRLHAASAGRATKAAYSCLRGMYVRYGTKQAPNFLELCLAELRRIPLPSAPVNKGCWEREGLVAFSGERYPTEGAPTWQTTQRA
jgi:hypothetical protein